MKQTRTIDQESGTVQLINSCCQTGLIRGFVHYSENGEQKTDLKGACYSKVLNLHAVHTTKVHLEFGANSLCLQFNLWSNWN